MLASLRAFVIAASTDYKSELERGDGVSGRTGDNCTADAAAILGVVCCDVPEGGNE